MMLKSGSTFLRLYFHKHQRRYAVFVNNTIVTDTKRVAEDGSVQIPDPKTEELHNKLLFSSYLESQHLSYGKRSNYSANNAMFHEKREAYLKKQHIKPYPISLQYLIDDKQFVELNKSEESALPDVAEESSEFPYKLKHNSKIITSNNPPDTWMTDYDYFDDATLKTEETENILTHTDHHNFNRNEVIDEDEYTARMIEKQQMLKNYGTPVPKMPVSSVKCGGCGSLLHCKDTSIPGYMPSEIFIGRSIAQLRDMHCQRCHFLKDYNIALNVTVDPEEYPKLLKEIKPKRALVVLMVDLLDFPCSIWPAIMDIIGHKRPIIIVGNKVDLLPEDSPGYLKHIEQCLKHSINNSFLSAANIKHVSLISAKTGFGVEELINKLHTIWNYSGDVYLIGCTNVGKSTLFNALLQSDYCKVQAADLLQRATISPWPGTTLNLLKFPILKPSGWRLQLRTKRLFSERAEAHAEVKLRREVARKTGNDNLASLIGHIGRTFVNPDKVVEPSNDPYSYQMNTGFTQSGPSRGISETAQVFAESKWCYDTPGVIHQDQILTILTIEELMFTLPKALIRPRTFYLKKGSTIFLAGLARLDFLECEFPVRFTVFASKYLPITICKMEDADELYSKLLGTEYFAVPRGNEDRLSKWPALKCSEDMKAIGDGWQKSVADVILSSAGWISITAKTEQECTVRAWTPDGRGIHLREPSLIRYAADMKGKRIKGSPAYNIGKIYRKNDKIQFKKSYSKV